MNNNFYAYAKSLIESMTLDELEERLSAYGIDCERKVTLYTTEQILNSDTALVASSTASNFYLEGMYDSTSYAIASNDNSFALAA